MNKDLFEKLTMAADSSSCLTRDLREAQRLACDKDPMVEILLRDLLGDAVKIRNRLEQIESCFH